MKTKQQEEIQILQEQLAMAISRLTVAKKQQDKDWLGTYIQATIYRLADRGVKVTKN